jgi:hypothetical protein
MVDGAVRIDKGSGENAIGHHFFDRKIGCGHAMGSRNYWGL